MKPELERDSRNSTMQHLKPLSLPTGSVGLSKAQSIRACRRLRSLLSGAGILLGTAGTAAAMPVTLFDRGLPNAPFVDSDQVVTSWVSDVEGNFVGDNFRIGTVGQNYLVNSLTVWGVQFDPIEADISSISLRVAEQGTDLGPSTEVATGTVTGNTSANTNITFSPVSFPSGDGYPTPPFKLFETTFDNLGLAIEGGVLYDFGITATGDFGFYSLATNGTLAGAPASAGYDDLLRIFNIGTGAFVRTANTSVDQTYAWNKSSDINVRITGTLSPSPIPEPATLSLMSVALAGMGVAGFRRRA